MASTSRQSHRAPIAALFSDLFLAEPDHLHLLALEQLLKQYFEAVIPVPAQFDKGVRDLAVWKEMIASKTEDELQLAIQRDFTRLFCLGKGSLGTTASVILSPGRLQKREPWEKVRRFYRENGWILPESTSAHEDSVAMEMAFYSLLIEQESDCEEGGKVAPTQVNFLNNHLLPWLPIFCKELYQLTDESSMYKSIASFLAVYINAEKELLDPVAHSTPKIISR